MTYKTPMKATDPCELERRIMDGSIAKNEAEWWAQHEIEQLRQRVQELEERRCEICGYAALRQQRDGLLKALENCRLLAARHRKEEWATHILRFCGESGVIGSPIRDNVIASVKEKA